MFGYKVQSVTRSFYEEFIKGKTYCKILNKDFDRDVYVVELRDTFGEPVNPIPGRINEMGAMPINLIHGEDGKMARSTLFNVLVVRRPTQVRDAQGNDATPPDTTIFGPETVFVPSEAQARILASTKIPAEIVSDPKALAEVEILVQPVFR